MLLCVSSGQNASVLPSHFHKIVTGHELQLSNPASLHLQERELRLGDGKSQGRPEAALGLRAIHAFFVALDFVFCITLSPFIIFTHAAASLLFSLL